MKGHRIFWLSTLVVILLGIIGATGLPKIFSPEPNPPEIVDIEFERLEVIFDSLGVISMACLFLDYQPCFDFVERVGGNPELHSAIRYATEKDRAISLYPSNRFDIDASIGLVSIDTSVTDAEIIKFLMMGKNP